MIRCQQLRPNNIPRELAMSTYLATRCPSLNLPNPITQLTSLSFNKMPRKNSVLYNELDEGALDDWCTERAQGKAKVMILSIIYGRFSFSLNLWLLKLDGVGPVDDRPSTD